MKFQPMGYQAVHTRMTQLQLRLDGQFGKRTEQGIKKSIDMEKRKHT